MAFIDEKTKANLLGQMKEDIEQALYDGSYSYAARWYEIFSEAADFDGFETPEAEAEFGDEMNLILAEAMENAAAGLRHRAMTNGAGRRPARP